MSKLLIIILLFGLLQPFFVLDIVKASIPTDGQYFTTQVSGNEVVIKNYNTAGGLDVVIPSTIDGKTVTAIGDFAFSYKGISSVIIPNTVTTIGDGAFEYNDLTSVEIPDSVTTIGNGAFYNNHLTSVEIPDSVATIGIQAFYNNHLTSVEIPYSVTTIGLKAFARNHLTLVTILSTDVTIESDAFSNQSDPSTLIIKGFPGSSAETYATINGITFQALPQNSTISPISGAFDKNPYAQNNHEDISVTMTLNSNTLSSIKQGDYTLIEGTDYTLSGNNVVISKDYLSTLEVGNVTLTFHFSGGEPQTFTVNVSDSTPPPPQNLRIVSVGDGEFKLAWDAQSNALSYKLYMSTTSQSYSDPIASNITDTTYTVTELTNGTTYYFVVKAVYEETGESEFSNEVSGVPAEGIQNSIINPTYKIFDKNPNAPSNHEDISITMTLNGNTLSSIKQGNVSLQFGTDYTYATVDTVVISKNYLKTLNVGQVTLEFQFSAGESQSLIVNVIDTTPPPAPPSGGGSSGGGSSSDSTLQPTTEVIAVDVETGNLGDVVVNKTTITRTKESNGTVRDRVTFTPQSAQDAIKAILDAGQTTARVVIPDAKDEVSQVDFTLPKATNDQLREADVNLEIYTENVRIEIPSTSLSETDQDFYFRIVPIKEEAKQKEVEERAQAEEMVVSIAQGQNVNVIARPVIIETNMQNRPVTLTLPLRDVAFPEDEREREQFLAQLAIFVEHSDGEKELIYPQVVEYKPGMFGLQFTVNKFSTFTILQIEVPLEVVEEEDQIQHHVPYIRGYEDGTFKPEQAITRAEMAVILARNLGMDAENAVFSSYPDVADSHWAIQEIEFVKSIGLMAGDDNGNFRPDAPITRGEIASIAARYKNLDITGFNQSSFLDVDASYWGASAIEAVRQAGIIAGYEDETYRPYNHVTRAEAVTIINRLFERGPLYGVTEPSWPDVPITHWAFYEIEEASQEHDFILRLEGGENIVK